MSGAGSDGLVQRVELPWKQMELDSACQGVTSETVPLAASLPSWMALGMVAGLRLGLQRRVAGYCYDPP